MCLSTDWLKTIDQSVVNSEIWTASDNIDSLKVTLKCLGYKANDCRLEWKQLFSVVSQACFKFKFVDIGPIKLNENQPLSLRDNNEQLGNQLTIDFFPEISRNGKKRKALLASIRTVTIFF